MGRSAIVEQAEALLAQGKPEAAIDRVSAAGARGEAAALNQLALWHVYGAPLPRDFARARAFFRRAGEAGLDAAALTHAVFVALGAGAPPDWAEAIRLLRQLAHRNANAAAQLALIDAMQLDATGRPVAPPAAELLSQSPHLGVVRALFTRDEAAHVAALAKPLLTPSIVADPATGRMIPHPIRTSDGAVLGPIQQDLVVHALNQRIAATTGTNVDQGEPLSVLRYRPQQQYRPHHDCLPGERNQRVLTAIVYLNEGYAGGATAFMALGKAVRGGTGDAIVFRNVATDGRADERSRHAGLPVERGEKWICTRWIRARVFDPWGLRDGTPR